MTLQKTTIATATTTTRIVEEIENNFDFMLSHFEQPVIFPRNVMATELLSIDQNKKYQRFKIVYSREEALTHFTKYNYVDCRINAFPSLKKEGVVTWKPELLFIDLDSADFKSTKSLELALSKTLKNIKELLNGAVPTILASGNGYHIIQPVTCPVVLEEIKQFSKYNKPSQEFLRFAKDFLSNDKADKNNYPSFNSCLLRIPGSINSKCLIVDNRDRRLSGNFRVKILQEWNGHRPLITRELLYKFHTHLNQKKANERHRINNKNNINKKKYYNYNSSSNSNHNNSYYNNSYIPWIEELLLQTPIEDCRKMVLWRILCPYLINVRKLSYDESFQILREWLDKCNSVRKLDFNPNQKIRDGLKHVGNFKPIGIQKLKTDDKYRKLYILLLLLLKKEEG